MKEISLRSCVTIVSDEDFDFLTQWNWCFDGRYAYRKEFTKYPKYKKIYMHRVLLNTPHGMMTDHINGNKLDNRRINLRICKRGQNEANKPKKQGCSSKFKGVSLFKKRNAWKAEIKFEKKRYHIGLFKNELEAAHAYNLKAKQLFGSFAILNVF
jgi:hypothetical protein